LIFVFLFAMEHYSVSTKRRTTSHRKSTTKAATWKNVLSFLVGILSQSSLFGAIVEPLGELLNSTDELIYCVTPGGEKLDIKAEYEKPETVPTGIATLPSNLKNIQQEINDYDLGYITRAESTNPQQSCNKIKLFANLMMTKEYLSHHGKTKTLINNIAENKNIADKPMTWQRIAEISEHTPSKELKKIYKIYDMFLSKYKDQINGDSKKDDKMRAILKTFVTPHNLSSADVGYWKQINDFPIDCSIYANIIQHKESFKEKIVKGIKLIAKVATCMGKSVWLSAIQGVISWGIEKILTVLGNMLTGFAITFIKIAIKGIKIILAVKAAFEAAESNEKWKKFGEAVGLGISITIDLVGGRRRKIKRN